MQSNSNKKVFLIHGFRGTPNGGWRSYLMKELDKQDIYACAISLPNPEELKLAEWLEEVKRHIERNQDDDVYLIGHSLGGTTILRYLEQFNSPNLKGVIIASAPCHQNANSKIGDFLRTDFDWQIMKAQGVKVVVIQGDNDPRVPMGDAEEIRRKKITNYLIVCDFL